MELLNPTITISNTDRGVYQVRFQHDFGNGEVLDITVQIPRQNHTLGQVSLAALDRAVELARLITPQDPPAPETP